MIDLSLPLEEPILIFTLVLFIILLAPTLSSRVRIPGIIGLILAGVLVGPNGLNLLLRDASIILFGTVGLLYIMFLAGLEIDLTDFQKNKNRSFVFGAFTFFIPQTIGMLVGYYLMGLGWASAVLLASMFASHTLLTYPIASRLGITKNEAVTVAVGGTIITDTAALLVLAIIARSTQGELNSVFWLRLVISFTTFVFIVLYLFPRIGTWFFKSGQRDGSSQYIFVLAVVFAAAFLAEVAGVEAIIGAFLAGLALNRLVPHTSPLMNRVEFVGNTLFIPFFLLSVGMLVDMRVLFQGIDALVIAATMIIVACACKWLAAFFTQQLFRYSRDERNIIFGLSNSQAAATLAAVLVGFDLGLLNENVLNGTILMILVTCLLSSFVTENAARRLAIVESEKPSDLSETAERILVPIANPATVEQLIDLAVLIKDPRLPEPIYPLVVVSDDDTAREKIVTSHKMLEKAVKHAAATETALQITSRVDLNIASGIARAIREMMITEVVIGWKAEVSTRDRIFGQVLDNLLEYSHETILVSKLVHPLNVTAKIVVAMPPHAELEIGFMRWVRVVRRLARQTGARLLFFGNDASLARLKEVIEQTKPVVEVAYVAFDAWEDFLILSRKVTYDDLLFIISARRGTVSYNRYLDGIPAKMAKHFQEISFVILYPEQNIV